MDLYSSECVLAQTMLLTHGESYGGIFLSLSNGYDALGIYSRAKGVDKV